MSSAVEVPLTVREAAAALNVSEPTIYRLIERGELQVLRVGFGPRAGIRIDPEELAATVARASEQHRARRARAMRMRIRADEG